MKLFFQLEENQQESALNYCMNIVLEDILDSQFEFNANSNKDLEIKNKIEQAIKNSKKAKSKEDKIKLLLADSVVYETVRAVALEMAKNAYYHEDEELVIFPNAINEEDQVDIKKLLSKDKKSNLN